MANPISDSPREHESYITLDTFQSGKGDPGGFGFGGANGVSGGFGVGGAGPQPGLEPHRQAHYRARIEPGATPRNPGSVARAHTTESGPPAHHDYPIWLDGFPHSFHGWGPGTPDSDAHDDAAGKAAETKSAQRIGFLELTVMKGDDPFATGLLWKQPD